MRVIHFLPMDKHLASLGNGHAKPWLKLPVPGLTEDEADALSEHLSGPLGWFAWHSSEEA